MIRLLEELESLRATETVKKSESFLLNIYRKVFSVVGKFYREDDARLVRTFGRDKMPLVENFKASVLSKPYDIRLLPSSNLPQTPAARIAAVAELMQIPGFFDLVPREQWADMLDLGNPGKFYDSAKAALSKAEWENEELIQGRTPPEPSDGDNHIVHWRTHCTLVESKSFLEFSESMKETAILHLMMHEMDMADHAEENPSFAQLLLQLPGYPKYYKLLPTAAPTTEQPQGRNEPNPEQPQQQGPGTFINDQTLDGG